MNIEEMIEAGSFINLFDFNKQSFSEQLAQSEKEILAGILDTLEGEDITKYLINYHKQVIGSILDAKEEAYKAEKEVDKVLMKQYVSLKQLEKSLED